MRTVNASVSTAIAAGTVKVCEIYILELASGTTYRYTSHSKDIVWDAGSNTYTSTVIVREPVQYTTNFESDSVRVLLGNISGDLYALVQANVLEAVKITIKRILWDDSYAADKEVVVFKGWADVEFNRQVLILTCRPLLDLMNVKVPKHTWQEGCNHRLFDISCTLIRTNYAYAGTATGGTTLTLVDTTRGIVYKIAFDNGDEDNPTEVGQTVTGGTGAGTAVILYIVYLTATTGYVWYVEQSGVQFVDDEVLTDGDTDTIIVNGTPAEDTSFYEMGEIEITGGDNDGQRRPILSNSSNTITVLWPFPSAIVNSDTYNIYPGCDKRAITCKEKFDNNVHFRGFLYIPKIEETIM